MVADFLPLPNHMSPHTTCNPSTKEIMAMQQED
jgi:hypothetical protein